MSSMLPGTQQVFSEQEILLSPLSAVLTDKGLIFLFFPLPSALYYALLITATQNFLNL